MFFNCDVDLCVGLIMPLNYKVLSVIMGYNFTSLLCNQIYRQERCQTTLRPSERAAPKGPHDHFDHAWLRIGPCIFANAEGQSGPGAQGTTLSCPMDDGPWIPDLRFGLWSPGIPEDQPHIMVHSKNHFLNMQFTTLMAYMSFPRVP